MRPPIVLAALIVSTVVVSLAEAQPPTPPPTPPDPPAQEEPEVKDPAAQDPDKPQDPDKQKPADDEEEPIDDKAEPGTRPRRPYRGLFGGGQSLSSRGESLDLTVSAIGGWDEPLDAPPVVNPLDGAERVDVEGPFTGASASAFYTRPGKELDIDAFGSAFGGYFPDNAEPWYTSSSAGLSAQTSFRLARRTSLDLSLMEGFSTDQRLGTMGGGLTASDIPIASGTTGFDTSLRRAPSLSTAPTVSLIHDFSRRSSLRGFYSYRYLYYLDRDADLSNYPNRQDHEVGFRFDRKMTRDLNLRAGYAYRRSNETGVDDSRRFGFHDIDVGADYGRALSLSRRTTFSFHTGSTVSASESGNDGSEGTFADTRFFLVGSAALTHEIGRSWFASADYTRDVGFEDGFNQPLLRDGAHASLNGLIGRRTDVSAELFFTSAAYGLEDRNFRSWTTSAQVRTAITRNLAAYAYYYYYLQDFDEGVDLPTGVVPNLARHGVRVGLSTWFPLWPSRGVQ